MCEKSSLSSFYVFRHNFERVMAAEIRPRSNKHCHLTGESSGLVLAKSQLVSPLKSFWSFKNCHMVVVAPQQSVQLITKRSWVQVPPKPVLFSSVSILIIKVEEYRSSVLNYALLCSYQKQNNKAKMYLHIDRVQWFCGSGSRSSRFDSGCYQSHLSKPAIPFCSQCQLDQKNELNVEELKLQQRCQY